MGKQIPQLHPARQLQRRTEQALCQRSLQQQLHALRQGALESPTAVRPSTIAGNGLFVTAPVPPHRVVALYPGTVYWPGEPMFLASLWNDYCITQPSGCTVDGKPSGISRGMYLSVQQRDEYRRVADTKWLGPPETLQASLHVGHFANHFASAGAEGMPQTPPPGDGEPESPAVPMPNAMYYSVSVPTEGVPLPVVAYGGSYGEAMDVVVLLTLSALRPGDEVLVDYGFIGHPLGTDPRQ